MRTTTIYSKATLKGMRRWYNKHHPREKRVRRGGSKLTDTNSSNYEGMIKND